MDKSTQIENIQKELEGIKKDNPQLYLSAKEHVKMYVNEHAELAQDKDLLVMLVYAVCKIGNNKVDGILAEHYRPYDGKFKKLVDGTAKSPEAMLRFLKTKLAANVERAMLAHAVQVLSRSNIRTDVEFPNDVPDEETGKKPIHKTFSVTLWDNDGKKIIPLFLVDDQVDAHSQLEAGKSYKMQIGNYNAEKDRWYASKDPSIVPLNNDAFKLDLVALSEYVLATYPKVKEPYDDVIADEKKNPNKRYAMQAQYVKTPSYIELLIPDDTSSYIIALPHSSMTKNLSNDGELIVVGKFQKSVPKGNAPKTSDYIMFPELILNLTSDGSQISTDPISGGNSEVSEENSSEKGNKDDLDTILG